MCRASLMICGVAMASLVLCSCTAQSRGSDLSSIQFLRLHPNPQRVELTARLEGVLALDGPCLSVETLGGSVQIIWPPTAELTTRRGKVAIRDTSTHRLYVVGERVVLGGGEITGISNADLDTDQPVTCAPPYFVANFPRG